MGHAPAASLSAGGAGRCVGLALPRPAPPRLRLRRRGRGARRARLLVVRARVRPLAQRHAPLAGAPAARHLWHVHDTSASRPRHCLQELPLQSAAMPVDELLPALYAPHPRADVAAWAREALRGTDPFAAFAARDDLVHQLESLSDDGKGNWPGLPSWAQLARSDIRPDLPPPTQPPPDRHRRRAPEPSSLPAAFAPNWPAADAAAGLRAARAAAAPRGLAALRAAPWLLAAREPPGPWRALPLWAWLAAAAASGPRGLWRLRLAAGKRLRSLPSPTSRTRAMHPHRRVSRGLRAAVDEPTLWRGLVRASGGSRDQPR